MSSSNPQRDPLDELLSAARWPEADAERLARLQRCWDAQQPQPAFAYRRVAVRYMAVAAAMLLAVGIVWWAADHRGNVGPENVPPEVARPGKSDSFDDNSASPRIAVDENSHPSPRERIPQPRRADKPVLAEATIGRPATPFEAALFRTLTSRRHVAGWRQDADVEAAIGAIRDDDSADPSAVEFRVAAAARPLLARRAYCERRLLESARYFDGTRRDAALKLLGHVGTTRTIRDILPLVEIPRAGHAAATAILRIAAPEKVVLLARHERDSTARHGLLATLAVAGDVRSVGALLSCVAHDATRQTAIDVFATVRPLPTASLLAWLESPDATRRAAAATALAVADDPAAVEKLVALARSGDATGAALIALVGSGQPAAREFIAAAKQTQLVSAVYEAQYQWRTWRRAAL